MGYIYVIKNIVNCKIYVGQTKRDINIRWREHKTNKNRLLSNDIKEFGSDKFTFILTKECSGESLEEEEIKLINEYNSLHPNGYNIELGSHKNLSNDNSSKGGKSEVGHDKQSLKVKERYKDNPILKDLREIPRGISYWKGFKNNKSYEGFKVRKIGIKNKECISPTEKNILQENLKRTIDYLNLHYE